MSINFDEMIKVLFSLLSLPSSGLIRRKNTSDLFDGLLTPSALQCMANQNDKY